MLRRALAHAPALALVVVRHAAPAPTRLSTGAVVAAVVAAVVVLACLTWAAARWWAYEPRWTRSLRHSLAEAAWRLGGVWEEFSDWVRLGR